MKQEEEERELHRFSFQLGMINCFAEMVACGVKRLAISPPVSPPDYDALKPYSDRIVEAFGIRSHLETSLLVTSLQSPEFTLGKWSILYFREEAVLTAYLDLKARQEKWVEAGRYDAEARGEIAVAFMELLSYPRQVIASKLAGTHPDPFVLVP